MPYEKWFSFSYTISCVRISKQSIFYRRYLSLFTFVRSKMDGAGNAPIFCAIEAGNNNVCKELLSQDPEQQV